MFVAAAGRDLNAMKINNNINNNTCILLGAFLWTLVHRTVIKAQM